MDMKIKQMKMKEVQVIMRNQIDMKVMQVKMKEVQVIMRNQMDMKIKQVKLKEVQLNRMNQKDMKVKEVVIKWRKRVLLQIVPGEFVVIRKEEATTTIPEKYMVRINK